jgi:hypothetical protein
VLGEPKIRVGATVIFGRTIAGVGFIAVIPAIPFVFSGLAMSGDMAWD